MTQLLPAAATSATSPAARRNWLKRLGVALGGGLLARAAAASPTEVQTSNDPYLGEIIMIAGSYAPRGYLLCQGQILSINQNTALFSVLGTQYGGNGITTFALPNLQGVTPIHVGTSSLGAASNGESLTLTASQLPAHTHAVPVSSGAATSPSPASQVRATTAGTNVNGEPVAVQAYTTAAPNAQAAPTAIGTAGSGQAATLRSPYLVINFCIALQGVYPPRP